MARGWFFLHSFNEERYRSSASLDSNTYSLRDICSVLMDFSNRQCTMITDRIYGLLSMLNVPETFPVNYNQNAATVVLDVLEHFQFKYLERNGKEIANASGFAVKAIHISYALRTWPLIYVTVASWLPTQRRSVRSRRKQASAQRIGYALVATVRSIHYASFGQQGHLPAVGQKPSGLEIPHLNDSFDRPKKWVGLAGVIAVKRLYSDVKQKPNSKRRGWTMGYC